MSFILSGVTVLVNLKQIKLALHQLYYGNLLLNYYLEIQFIASATQSDSNWVCQDKTRILLASPTCYF